MFENAENLLVRIHKIYWTIKALKMHIFRKKYYKSWFFLSVTNVIYNEIHKIFVCVPTFLLGKFFLLLFLFLFYFIFIYLFIYLFFLHNAEFINPLSKSRALMRNLLVRMRSKFALINSALFYSALFPSHTFFFPSCNNCTVVI